MQRPSPPRCARVGLNDVGDVVLHRKLDVDQPLDLELLGDLDGPLTDDPVDLDGECLGGDAAGGVACVEEKIRVGGATVQLVEMLCSGSLFDPRGR